MAYYRWIDELIEHLRPIEFHSVINASFYTQIDFNDTSMRNTFIKNNWHEFNEEIMLSIVKDCNNYVMSKKIIDSIFKSHSFFYNKTKHFLAHQKQLAPHVTDWLVVGNAWGCCTHREEMGLHGFKMLEQDLDFSHLSFYGTTWGFVKADCSTCSVNDFYNDQWQRWHQLSGDLFRLV